MIQKILTTRQINSLVISIAVLKDTFAEAKKLLQAFIES